MVVSIPGYSVCPMHSSPLAQGSSRFPSLVPPPRHEYFETSSKPIPVPSASYQAIHSPPQQPGCHPTSIPSPTSSASLDGPIHPSAVSPSSPSAPSRRRPSHSHSLAGSYTLSLLSSRMSHAHAPHSVSSAFQLQIGCSSFGKEVPARLRCPKHVKIDFDATYYDLDDGNSPGAVSTPWVGCVDVQEHYYRILGQDVREQTTKCSPPRFPGYEVPSNGLLQLVVKNDFHALKVFLINYDLTALEPGGKMLVRERGYQAVSASTPRNDRRASFGGSPSSGRREILRFTVEMQFTCVLESKAGEEMRPKKSRKPRSHLHGIVDRLESRASTPTPAKPYKTTKIRKNISTGRSYYLSKAVRIVFPPLVDHGNPTSSNIGGRSTPTVEKLDMRTERFVEVINPAIASGMRGDQVKALRKGSFASETWEGLREEWLKRMKEETEGDGSADEDETFQARQSTLKRSPGSSYETRDQFNINRIKIQPQPMKSRSLLSAKFSPKDILDPFEGLDADGVSIRRRDGTPRHRASSPWDAARNGHCRRTMDEESERMLSESLENMISPRNEGLRLGQPDS